METTAPEAHAPDWHVSPVVQALPSLQAVPSGAAGFEQTPVAGKQLPTEWQASLGAGQVTGFEPVQVPATHASVCVHAFVSLQAVPSGAAGFEQTPVAGEQLPT